MVVICSAILGGIYAISSEWTVYYGRIGIKFPVHDGWSWLCGPGPYTQSINTETQSYITHICGISVYSGLILHMLDIYADEVAVSNDRVSRALCGSPLYWPSAEGLPHGYFRILQYI